MLTVRFEEHKARFAELLLRKMQAATHAAAIELNETYHRILLKNIAPPHSRIGEIPHAYLGHKPGGFGPRNGVAGSINNTARQGFSGSQITFLATYIDAARGRNGGAVVGFSPSHVTTRQKNYLIGWDQGRIDGDAVPTRPWIRPWYEIAKPLMVDVFKAQFKAAK